VKISQEDRPFVVGVENELIRKDFIQEARFEHVGVFTYSLEEGTPAFGQGDPVPTRTKNSRKRRIMELQQKICREKNRALEGRVLQVLVEGAHEETDLVFKGRHMGQAPEVDGGVLIVGGDVQVGTIQAVRITKGHAYDLVGEVVEGGAEAAVRSFEEARRSRS